MFNKALNTISNERIEMKFKVIQACFLCGVKVFIHLRHIHTRGVNINSFTTFCFEFSKHLHQSVFGITTQIQDVREISVALSQILACVCFQIRVIFKVDVLGLVVDDVGRFPTLEA